jgi:CD109 antigen
MERLLPASAFHARHSIGSTVSAHQQINLVQSISFNYTLFARDETINDIFFVLNQDYLMPNENYPVIFQTVNSTNDFTFSIAIESENREAELDKLLQPLRRETTLEANTRKTIYLPIPDLPPNDYRFSINVTSKGKQIRKESVGLKFPLASFMILLQTDKGMYKPGDLVRFRVLVLDNDRRPLSNQTLQVHLTDTKLNRIKQWMNATLDEYGHFEGDYRLSSNAQVGSYQLQVEVKGKKRMLTIEVDEYVLPQVEVKVDTPPFLNFQEPQLPIVIDAKYTHGKAVRGTVKITFSQKHYFRTDEQQYWPEFAPVEKCHMVKPINGKVELVFDPVKHLKLQDAKYNIQIEVKAVVTETLTGRNYTGSASFEITDKHVKLSMVSKKNRIKPGLTYFGGIKITNHDDKPILDLKDAIHFGYRFNTEKNFTMSTAVPIQGILPLTVMVPRNASALYVRVMYKNERYNLPTAFSQTLSAESMEIQFVPYSRDATGDKMVELIASNSTDSPTKARVRLQSNVPVQQYNYLVMARNRIVHSESVTEVNSDSFELTFDLLPSMLDGFNLLVYTFDSNSKQVAVEQIKYKPNMSTMPRLKLSADKQTARPGDQVQVQVTGPPSSFIAVLGIDQSAMLLKEPAMIDEKQFASERPSLEKTRGRFYYDTADTAFRKAKVHFISNAQAPHIEHPYRLYSARGGSERAVMMFDAAPMSAKAANFEESAPEVRVRKHFPETWLWDSAVSHNESGAVSFERRVPDTITSWVVNAFGVHPQSGLSVSDAPLKLTVFNPFFIKTNLPYSIVRDEVAAIQVLVYNYLGSRKHVDVTLHNEFGDFLFTKTPAETIMSDNDLMPEVDQTRAKRSVVVEADQVASVTFLIRAKQVGYIKLQLVAQVQDGTAGDKVEQLLLVKPEGQTQHFNKAMLLSLKNSGQTTAEQSLSVEIPEDAVAGSRLLSITAIGDVIGVSFSNVENLLRMPYGCGEQNMAGLVPNIVALDYLNSTGQLTSRLKARSVNHLEQGYARQLKYQHLNGGFSAFGVESSNASTWLTAYVVAWFVPAQKSIPIEMKVLQNAIKFLQSNRNADGDYLERGHLYDLPMSGGVGNALDEATSPALNAFVLSKFASDPNPRSLSNQFESLWFVVQWHCIALIRSVWSPAPNWIGRFDNLRSTSTGSWQRLQPTNHETTTFTRWPL